MLPDGALEPGRTALISDLLFDTISYFDYKESFYHAFLTGLFPTVDTR